MVSCLLLIDPNAESETPKSAEKCYSLVATEFSWKFRTRAIFRFSVLGILKKIFRKREKPRVFPGTIVVVPRAGLKPRFDQWGALQREELEAPLQATLQQVFSLPPAGEVRDPLPTDLGLDVFVPSFQSGDFLSFSLGDLGIPIF